MYRNDKETNFEQFHCGKVKKEFRQNETAGFNSLNIISIKTIFG